MTSEKAAPSAQPRRRRGVCFGKDGTPRGRISARIPLELSRETKMLAVEQDRSVNDLVEDALRRYIAHVDAQAATKAAGSAE